MSVAWFVAGIGAPDDTIREPGKASLIRLSAIDAGIPADVIDEWFDGFGHNLTIPVDHALTEMRGLARMRLGPSTPDHSKPRRPRR